MEVQFQEAKSIYYFKYFYFHRFQEGSTNQSQQIIIHELNPIQILSICPHQKIISLKNPPFYLKLKVDTINDEKPLIVNRIYCQNNSNLWKDLLKIIQKDQLKIYYSPIILSTFMLLTVKFIVMYQIAFAHHSLSFFHLVN